jgi:hypothetical protein
VPLQKFSIIHQLTQWKIKGPKNKASLMWFVIRDSWFVIRDLWFVIHTTSSKIVDHLPLFPPNNTYSNEPSLLLGIGHINCIGTYSNMLISVDSSMLTILKPCWPTFNVLVQLSISSCELGKLLFLPR